MSAPPILSHDDWDGLIAALAALPGSSFFRELDGGLARAVLAAPAALALWIAHRVPQLAAHERLRLLVIGAETVDAADEGRWYSLLPRLLSAGFEVEATLVGSALDPGFVSAAARFAPPRPARLLRTELAEFLGGHDAGAFDLAVVFQPGMQKNRGWLADASLARAIAAGAPLIASSYDTDEAEVDRWVLECYGYGVSGEVLLNPFFLELGDGGAQVRWGRALWQFAGRVPPPGYTVDGNGLAALDTLTRMVMHSMAVVDAPSFTPGAPVRLQGSGGRRADLIHIFDRRFVDPATRRMLMLTGEGELRGCGELAAADLAAYPGPAAREIERAMWAARVKAERLLSQYPAGTTAESADATASRMLAEMRERARRLFGK